jgi:chromosome segregation ATPase
VQALRAAAADKRIAELEPELEKARGRIAEQEIELRLSNERSVGLEAELEESYDRLAELESELRHSYSRIAGLDTEILQSYERLSHQHNKVASLETSLSLKTDENLHLRGRLAEVLADMEAKRVELTTSQAELAAAKLERTKANEERQAKVAARDEQLEVVLMRAECAEKMLGEVQQRLIESEAEIQRLRTAQAELIADLSKRDSVLMNSEQKMGSLVNLFSQLETAAVRARNETEFNGVAPFVQDLKRRASESDNPTSFNSGVLDRELAEDAWLFESVRSRPAVRSPQSASPLTSQRRSGHSVKSPLPAQNRLRTSLDPRPIGETRTPRRGDGRGV